MEQYSTYKSAVHALCVLAQKHFGIPEGLDICNALLDEGPADGGCDAVLLAVLLDGIGLPAEAIEVRTRDIEDVITDALLARRDCCFQVDTAEDPSLRRWAVVAGSDRDNVFFAVCAGPDDDPYMPVDIRRHPTGQAVRLAEATVTRSRLVLAIKRI